MEPKSQHLAPQTCELVKEVANEGVNHRYTLKARWGVDNGRHTFSIGIEIERAGAYMGHWNKVGSSRSPELMAQLWPEHLRALDYHLVSLSGPLHYIANTVYLAGIRDCFGWEPGEQRKEKETGMPLWRADTDLLFHVMASATPPAPLELQYEPMRVEKPMNWGPNKGIPVGEPQRDADGLHLWRIPGTGLPLVRSLTQPKPLVFQLKPYLGEGKERDLAAARVCAIWPDATDEELSVPEKKLEAALQRRLPKLLWELKAVVESFGMTY